MEYREGKREVEVPFRRFFDSFLVKSREVQVEIEIDREMKKR